MTTPLMQKEIKIPITQLGHEAGGGRPPDTPPCGFRHRPRWIAKGYSRLPHGVHRALPPVTMSFQHL